MVVLLIPSIIWAATHFGGVGAGIAKNLNNGWSARGDYRLMAVGADTEINHAVLASLMYRFGTSGDGSGTGDGLGADGKALKTVYFNFDSSNLSNDSRSRLQDNAGYLKSNPKEKAVLEGHCDERGSNEYNMALGEQRALAVRQYIIDKGIPAGRIQTISYGEEKAAVQGHDEQAWSQNRRAHFMVANEQ